ncbi:FtsH protease activity modulator HflK [Thiomicrorhabdus sp. ZW0627]|uniref:FtsH protease activity modulator HflK n=1 Tax=Thiomicrorhabdus sp. ZW0627 TaxID=3039774 RepID=UPI0024370C1B|nr:FtsH protease activity modulator HflK [Thiomicrorhabdus sp. ZW0627]MDG6773124.1 FtsH protease activity modulator HflK [Thiomicrorhabdus sp. ZW0627]
MAWNEPGKSDQDPWGNPGNSGNQGGNRPPRKNNDQDIDALLKKAQSLFGGAGDKFNSGGVGGIGGSIILGVVLVIWLLSGIYIVDPAERGVVTRFGAFVEETKAGPHWHIPYPIETVRVVNVDQIRTAEIGYRSDTRNSRSGDVPTESLMLTKDENIVDLKIAVQYKIESANQYLFEVSDPDVTLRSVVESALREVVGQNRMDFVLTEGRNEVVSKVQQLAQANLNDYRTGLMITSVNLQDAQPPEQVQDAFADVVKAREDRERVINEAEAYSNDILPKARGKAARELEEASAYHDRVIAQATGEAARFSSIVAEYEKAPEVTRQRLYIDAISNVLGNTSKVFVGSEGGNNLLYLPLDKMIGGQQAVPFKPAATQAAPVTSSSSDTRNSSSNNSKSSPNIREYLRNRELR